jgi:hypothetical protein
MKEAVSVEEQAAFEARGHLKTALTHDIRGSESSVME